MTAADTYALDEQPVVAAIRSTRTFEAAIENILDGIERSQLRVGDRLPNESELARQLGISIPTLRQALRVLQRSSVLVVRQGKMGGIFIASDFLPVEAISSEIALEEAEVIDALRGRRIIEQTVTEIAAAVATDTDFLAIERTVELLRRDGIGRSHILRADAMFHRAVARATHNSVLQDTMRVVYAKLASIRDRVSGERREAERVYEIHARQLEAMRGRDPAELAAALDAHFRFQEDSVAQELERPWEELFGPEWPRHAGSRGAAADARH